MRIRSPGRSMVTLVLISLGPVVAPASTLAAEPGEADATAAAGTYVLADANSQGGDAVGKLTGDGQEISWSWSALSPLPISLTTRLDNELLRDRNQETLLRDVFAGFGALPTAGRSSLKKDPF